MKNLMICTNNEHMRDVAIGALPRELNEGDALNESDIVDLADRYVSTLIDALNGDKRIDGVDEDKTWSKWNGGEFAHQAERYGHDRVGSGVILLRANRLSEGDRSEVEDAVAEAQEKADAAVLDLAKALAEDNRRFKAEQEAEEAE